MAVWHDPGWNNLCLVVYTYLLNLTALNTNPTFCGVHWMRVVGESSGQGHNQAENRRAQVVRNATVAIMMTPYLIQWMTAQTESDYLYRLIFMAFLLQRDICFLPVAVPIWILKLEHLVPKATKSRLKKQLFDSQIVSPLFSAHNMYNVWWPSLARINNVGFNWKVIILNRFFSTQNFLIIFVQLITKS